MMGIMPFEKAFDNFLERREYDKAEDALFSIVRIAYTAGWLAAGGEPPQSQKVLLLVKPQAEMQHKNIKEIKDAIHTNITLKPES